MPTPCGQSSVARSGKHRLGVGGCKSPVRFVVDGAVFDQQDLVIAGDEGLFPDLPPTLL
jgi:hypothetical protein